MCGIEHRFVGVPVQEIWKYYLEVVGEVFPFPYIAVVFVVLCTQQAKYLGWFFNSTFWEIHKELNEQFYQRKGQLVILVDGIDELDEIILDSILNIYIYSKNRSPLFLWNLFKFLNFT